jgi:hypothetical protein
MDPAIAIFLLVYGAGSIIGIIWKIYTPVNEPFWIEPSFEVEKDGTCVPTLLLCTPRKRKLIMKMSDIKRKRPCEAIYQVRLLAENMNKLSGTKILTA